MCWAVVVTGIVVVYIVVGTACFRHRGLDLQILSISQLCPPEGVQEMQIHVNRDVCCMTFPLVSGLDFFGRVSFLQYYV